MGDDLNEALLTMSDLPENCLSRVLELTTPKDVCRVSVLCRALKFAGNSNCVWEKMLPPHHRDLLARACNPLQFNSKKELYFSLCEPVSIDKGTKKFWLDKATGKACFMLSPRDLAITWGGDDRYWHWISRDGSSFEDIAELIAVCWFEVQGVFDCKLLSPGIAYTVSFKLKLNGPASNHRRRLGTMIHAFHMNHRSPYGWDIKPVKFSVTTSWGHQQQSARFLRNTENPVDNEGYQMTSFRHVGKGWMEFDAGEFFVEENEDGPKEVKFYMNELIGGDWKGGLLLEGVKIQPSYLVTERHNVREE
ncbi:hypothetical protein SUGI_0491480 [Cryptomeria japonica]|uniref:F-box protein At2g02240 isoform X2 n=1 Tax=Cryptomeria japonica TaxID=3369 RepID=UPI002408A747|nr:F-box protein At2g02240 isoform X2 [Cryptomeria japonica]GLJ25658.1 hypothetical protein SUGI_0491480 [Cryptomeria japonica]